MHITRFQVEKWVKVLRVRGMSGHLDAKDVIEVLENDAGAGITPVTLPLSPIPANLDDDALADALAEDMAMALNEDAAGAVWDTRVVDLPGPITEGPEVDAAVRAWMIEVLGMVAGLQPQATTPLRQPIDSLERLILGRPRGSAPSGSGTFDWSARGFAPGCCCCPTRRAGPLNSDSRPGGRGRRARR